MPFIVLLILSLHVHAASVSQLAFSSCGCGGRVEVHVVSSSGLRKGRGAENRIATSDMYIGARPRGAAELSAENESHDGDGKGTATNRHRHLEDRLIDVHSHEGSALG